MGKSGLLKGIIVGAIGSLMLMSCSVERKLVGRWEVTHNIYQQAYTADKAKQEATLDSIYHDTTFVDHQKGYMYEFKENNTGKVTPTKGTGGQVTPFKYSRKEDNELTIIMGSPEKWEIKKLNSRALILVSEIKKHRNTADGIKIPHTEMNYQRMEMKKR